jgi:hypothetical protein
MVLEYMWLSSFESGGSVFCVLVVVVVVVVVRNSLDVA